MKTFNKVYKLDYAACDEIAERVTVFCQEVGADRKDAIRYRLSTEECLLFWLEQGLQSTDVDVSMGSFMRTPYITLEAKGANLNPYAEADEEMGTYTESVLVSLGLNPEYSYASGCNRITFRVKKKPRSQVATLFLVLAASVAIGALGLVAIPANIRTSLIEVVINPLYESFFKILGCIAGPMIFLSVAWGVYGIGDAATFSRIGRKMMLRYTLISIAAAFLCTPFISVFGLGLSAGAGGHGQLGSVVEMLFGIIPSSIVEPFASGNTLQIIFMSVCIGVGLLYMGRRTSAIANAIDQVNLLVQFLMQFISKMVPSVIFLVVLSLVWSDELSIFSMAWKLFATMFVMMILLTTLFLAVTSIRLKVSPLLIIQKNLQTFLIALTTASSAASFGSNVDTCEKKFGIDPSLIRFGIPLGIVMSKPITAAYNVLVIFYFASQYDLSCSIAWVCIAAFISGVVAIATPPIPGGGAVAYSILFLQLGIPSEALAVALMLDMISDFFITSFDMFNLTLAIINISSGIGMIDTEVLRRDI